MLKAVMIISLFLSITVFTGCDNSDEKEDVSSGTANLDIPSGFNFEMEKALEISASLKNGAQGLPGIKSSLFTAIPEAGGKLIASSISDSKGDLQIQAVIPGHLNEVFLQFNYVGLVNGVWVNTETGTVVEKSDESEDLTQPYESLVNTKMAAVTFSYLGSFNSDGVPAYLEEERDQISPDFLEDVNASLPERIPLTESHPGYMTTKSSININITEEADVWITFLHEGAGNKNVLGFYTYEKGNEPESVSEIDKHTVIFPNTSYLNSGGGLYSGDKVFIGRFSKDTVIGFFLISAGFSGGSIIQGRQIFYSDTNLNPETGESLKQHNVMIWDEERELILMGFEDLRRDSSGCDNDFNDAVFFVTSNPVEAIDTSEFKPIDKPVDTDNDGISDVFDEYPEDPARAFNNYYPSRDTSGTLTYEDSWPKKGDYDFNDAFFHYSYNYVTNSDGDAVEIKAVFKVIASGAAYYNGPAIMLDLPPEKVKKITGQKLFEKIFSLNENGTEKDIAKTVIPVTDNIHKLMENESGVFINTDPELPYVEPVEISILIEFNAPVKIQTIGLPPYNPFLIVNKNRAKEIHLPGRIYSQKADTSYFGTQDDATAAESVYYLSKDNLPWALSIPYEIIQMRERIDILEGYPNFGNWAKSAGTLSRDWYVIETEGNMVEGKVYRKQ